MSRTHQLKKAEMEYWEKVPIDAMSEESDGEVTQLLGTNQHGDRSICLLYTR